MPASTRILSPRSAVDRSASLHVIWASSDSEVFHATRQRERWSVPEVVAQRKRFYWDWANTSPIVTRGDTLRILVNSSDGLLYIRGVRGSWLARRVDGLAGGPITRGYPRLTILPNGRLVMVFQGAAPDVPKRGRTITSRVYATWSDDDGVTWVAQRPVSSLAMEPAFDFQLLQARDGRLRVVWYQMTDSSGAPASDISLGGSPGRVYVAESWDRGETWHAGLGSALLRYAGSLDAQLLDDSSVVVALLDRHAEELLLATWSHRWRPFSRIDAKPDPRQIVLGRDDAQRLVLTWGAERASPRRWVSMVSMLTPCG